MLGFPVFPAIKIFTQKMQFVSSRRSRVREIPPNQCTFSIHLIIVTGLIRLHIKNIT